MPWEDYDDEDDELDDDYTEFNLRNLRSALKKVSRIITNLEKNPPAVGSALSAARSAKKSVQRAIDTYPSDYPRRRRVIVQPPPPPPPEPGMSENTNAFQIPAEHVAEMEDIAEELRDLADRLVGEHEVEDSPTPAPETPDYSPDLDIEVPTPEIDFLQWAGPITFENIKTGDNRIFSSDAVQWDTELLPFPFKWQRVSADGHDQSITIGRVDSISRLEDGIIWAEGVILTGESAPVEADEYINLLKNGAAGGVSIDGDDAEFEITQDSEGNPQMTFSRINIRALTAVDIPAFAGARIALKETITAAVIGSTDLPVAPRDRRWDGLAAQRTIFSWAKEEDGFDTAKLARAFLWRDSDGDPELKGSYKLPFTEVLDGTLTIVPKAVFAAAAAVEGARGGVNIPDDEKSGIRRKLATLYRKINSSLGPEDEPVTPPWEEASTYVDFDDFKKKRKKRRRWTYNELVDLETIVAGAVPVDPPGKWFDNPEFSELTPIKITDEGQIFGHLAGWDTCHIGMGSCRTAPQDCDYDSYFHLGGLKTAEGEEIYVGHMTFGGGHAPLNYSSQGAAAFYDSTSTVSADIRAGEDEFGVWVAGALRPGMSDEEIREIRSAPLSGDWRPIAGKLQLIAAHGVNVPGFPIPRAKVLVASGITQTLILTEECECDEFATSESWDGSSGRFTDEQYQKSAAACDPAEKGTVKQRCFLPHHEPGGALNINGLHNAAARISQLKGRSPEAIRRAKSHLRGHYREVKEEIPEVLEASEKDVIEDFTEIIFEMDIEEMEE